MTCVLTLADAEHLAATDGVDALGSWPTVFHGNGFGVFHYPPGSAFNAICFQLSPPVGIHTAG